jgi:hypothetical protein
MCACSPYTSVLTSLFTGSSIVTSEILLYQILFSSEIKHFRLVPTHVGIIITEFKTLKEQGLG